MQSAGTSTRSDARINMSLLTKRLLTRSIKSLSVLGHIWDVLTQGLGSPWGGGGGWVLFLGIGYWGCTAGWDRIFTTGLTIIELHFHLSY